MVMIDATAKPVTARLVALDVLCHLCLSSALSLPSTVIGERGAVVQGAPPGHWCNPPPPFSLCVHCRDELRKSKQLKPATIPLRIQLTRYCELRNELYVFRFRDEFQTQR